MEETFPTLAAIRANLAVIRQGIVLLTSLRAEHYGQRLPLCFNASVGGHLRHIIEHYQAFLRGLDEEVIAYEQRVRDPLAETDPVFAIGQLEAIAEQLESMITALPNRALHYRTETLEGAVSGTTVLRELEFLVSHTIHHYALVGVMARLQGHEPEPEFGIAPSTLKFRRQQLLCAP
ncbi:MAG TPA: DinB family protein [Phycisphaerae bacterium]|nr:DinB family protein [Phycisphaerae bacterium]